MIYVVEFPGYIKLGFANHVGQRLADGFYSNSHPRALCNQLTMPCFRLIAQYTGSDEDERELQTQFNEEELKRSDCANEFYDVLELPKILRDLDTYFIKMPIEQEYPPPRILETQRPCCLGRAITCRFCGSARFVQFWNRSNHEIYNCHKNPNRKAPDPCRFCGKILSDPDGVKKHENHHCPENPNKTERPDKKPKL